MPKKNSQSPRLTRAKKRLAEESQNSNSQQSTHATPVKLHNDSKETKPTKQVKSNKRPGRPKLLCSPDTKEVASKPTKKKTPTKPKAANKDISTKVKVQERKLAANVPQPSNPKPIRVPRPKKMSIPPDDQISRALEEYAQLAEVNERLTVATCQSLRREFKMTCDKTKRATQKLEQESHARRPAGTTRSGTVRGAINRPVFTDGKWVNRGIDDAQDKFDVAELDYLKKSIVKVKDVHDLKLEHIKYLIMDIFLEELKSIQKGETKSYWHDEYLRLKGKARTELYSEIRTNLFSEEQKDYLNGLLQGAFDTCSRDANGDIKHSDMNYVGLVMLAESTIRIVKHVHKFTTNEEALAFMKRSSRRALGCCEDDDDDDEY